MGEENTEKILFCLFKACIDSVTFLVSSSASRDSPISGGRGSVGLDSVVGTGAGGSLVVGAGGEFAKGAVQRTWGERVAERREEAWTGPGL